MTGHLITRRVGALLVASSTVVLLSSCGGDGGSATGPPPAPAQVASVQVQPTAPTLDALGVTVQLTATAYTSSGSAMTGRTFAWQSSSPSVATVDGQGRVTAVGNGATTIRAETGGVTGSVQITVNNDFDADGILNRADGCPNEGEVYNNWADTDGCPDDSLELYAIVRQLAEGYWQQAFSSGEMVYQPLSTFVPYAVSVSTPCGVLGANNAYYCLANHGVYFHRPFLDSYLEQVGDAAPAFIIAHEIGHHVSYLTNWYNSGVTLKQLELQADCLGGAFIRESALRGWLEEGDLEEIVVALISAGDPADIWFNPTGHGTSEERVTAFGMGYLQGPGACPADVFPAFSVSHEDRYGIGPRLPPRAESAFDPSSRE